MPGDVMIEASGLGKRYRGRPPVVALHDVSLTIPRGRVTAVVGPNGAGKSTLFGVLLGFLHATSGDVAIGGVHPQDYMREQGIGYVPERFALPSGWPVGRAMAALGGLSGLTTHQIGAALDSFGISEHRDKTVGSLSRGLLQRLGLAQAFAAGRDLLVLDEPAEGLDPVWRIRLRDRIAEQRAAGRTVLLASHDLAEVERVADLVIILDRGAVRETVPLTGDAAPNASRDYRLRLETSFADITTVFPGAQLKDDGEYLVHASDASDLSRRIAALIEMGGRIVAVHADPEPLEDRVRRTMDS